MQQFASLNLQPHMSYKLQSDFPVGTLCSAAAALYAVCDPNPITQVSLCVSPSSHPALLLKLGVLEPILTYCGLGNFVMNVVNDTFYRYGGLGMQLQHPRELDNSVLTFTRAILQVAANQAWSSMFLPLSRMQNPLGTVPLFDPSVNATARFPPGCQCSFGGLTPTLDQFMGSLASGVRSTCFFRPAFDAVPTDASPLDPTLSYLPCSPSQIPLAMRLSAFANVSDLAEHVFGLPAQVAVFLPKYEPEDVSWKIVYQGLAFLPHHYLFDSYDATTLTVGDVRRSSLHIDYDAYFQACAPATCTYVTTAPPSAVLLLTTALGIAGGGFRFVHVFVNILATVAIVHACRGKMRSLRSPARIRSTQIATERQAMVVHAGIVEDLKSPIGVQIQQPADVPTTQAHCIANIYTGDGAEYMGSVPVLLETGSIRSIQRTGKAAADGEHVGAEDVLDMATAAVATAFQLGNT
jgi:hypothetical protein